METSDFVDLLRTISAISGGALTATRDPAASLIGGGLINLAEAPDIFRSFGQQRQQASLSDEVSALAQQEADTRQQATDAIKTHLNRLVPVDAAVNIPIEGTSTPAQALMDIPPRPQNAVELSDALTPFFGSPGSVTLLRHAGYPTQAGQAAAQAAREATRALQDRKLQMLRELRGMQVPEGTKQRIQRASTMQELIDASAAIQAALSIENATPARLAFLATGTGPEASRARQALELLSPGETRATMAQLARQAAAGDPVAARAIQILRELRSTGVVKRERKTASEELPPFITPPHLKPLPGGGVQGTGRPRVKSFKRIN